MKLKLFYMLRFLEEFYADIIIIRKINIVTAEPQLLSSLWINIRCVVGK